MGCKLTTGFFGYPAEESYNLEVMIESPGFNCTLAPWNSVGTILFVLRAIQIRVPEENWSLTIVFD